MTVVEGVAARPQAAPSGYLTLLLQSRPFLIGAAIFLTVLLSALAGSLFVDAAQRRTGAFLRKQPPGGEFILGTDSVGRSIAIQLTDAVPNSVQVGLVAATLGTVLGALIGFASGYFAGWVDALLRVLIDVFLSVPSLLFLILIASLVRGMGVTPMALIIGLFAWAWPARQVRAQVLSLKERPFVDVARLSGLSGPEIIVRELLPHMLPWLGANFANAFLVAILAESGLSIIGLGPQREMTLGMMIYWALSYGAMLQNLWWWWGIPVVMLIVLFLSLYLIHLGFDEISNPRLRVRA